MITKPNFILAGFPKCGTTSLFAYLEEHPEIFIPKRKEMNFFTNPIISKLTEGKGDKIVNAYQVSNWEEYISYYTSVKNEKAVGDASPSYINFPSCFDEINQKLNNPKIIIIVRDPIKRAFSNYLHLYKKGRETLDFYSAIHEEENRKALKYSPFWYYKKHSLYYDKIVQAKESFSDVLVLTQEELKLNSKKVLKEVFEFLEVNSDFIPNNLDTSYNVGGVYKKNFITNIFTRDSYFKNQILKKLPMVVKIKPLKDKILKNFQTSAPTIDLESENVLVEYFKEDVAKLSELGINTALWNEKYFSK